MYGYIYKITNLINNKFYIGKHKYPESQVLKEGIDQAYFGSGKLLKQAVKKYGKENFKQEILQYANSEVELNELEISWIKTTEATLLGYNLASGGEGGDNSEFIDYSTCAHYGSENWNFGKEFEWYNNGVQEIRIQKGDDIPENYTPGRLPMSEEQKKLLSLNHTTTRESFSEDTLRMYSEKWSGENNPQVKDPKFGDRNSFYGRHHSEDTKKINSEKHKIKYKCPFCGYVSNHGGVTKHLKSKHIELLESASTIESIVYEKYVDN